MNPIKVIIQVLRIFFLFMLSLFGFILILSHFDVSWALIIKERALFSLQLLAIDGSIFNILFGLLLIMPFVIMIVNLFIPDINSSRYLSIGDSTGYIHISIKAIADYIKQIALEYEDIEAARPRLFYKDGNIEILLYLSVTSKQNIIGLSEVLKSDICNSLAKATAISQDNIGKIEIVVENIKINKKIKVTKIKETSTERSKK